MNTKTVLLVVIASITIGVVVFFVGQTVSQSSFKFPPNIQQITSQSTNQLFSPTPIPKPTPPPIGPDSNLEEEISKLTPPDFSADFEQLRKQL